MNLDNHVVWACGSISYAKIASINIRISINHSTVSGFLFATALWKSLISINTSKITLTREFINLGSLMFNRFLQDFGICLNLCSKNIPELWVGEISLSYRRDKT